MIKKEKKVNEFFNSISLRKIMFKRMLLNSNDKVIYEIYLLDYERLQI